MTKNYFNKGLNYSLANEDTRLEIAIAKKYQPKSILAVSGSGSRALSLLMPKTESLHLFDLSNIQLELAKHRLKLIKEKSFPEYLKVMGYEGDESDLIYQGRWERTFAIFSKLAKIVFWEGALDSLLKAQDLEAQKRIFFSISFRVRWLFLIFLLGNKAVFNALLYKGDFIKKNCGKSYFEFYKKRFDHNFQTNLLSENFFLQLCLFGKIVDSKAFIPEATLEVFNKMKESRAQIEFLNQSFDQVVKGKHQYDFVSMSDIISYFGGELEKSFLAKLKKILTPNAIVVLRNYLRIPEGTMMNGYRDITLEFEKEINEEYVGVYDIQILMYLGE